MFQDLNRKLHHAEKQDRESPASDSKVKDHIEIYFTVYIKIHIVILLKINTVENKWVVARLDNVNQKSERPFRAEEHL